MKDAPGERDKAIPGTASVRPARAIPHEPTNLQRCAAGLFRGVSRALVATLGERRDNRFGFFDRKQLPQAIYCIWHNRLSVCLNMYGKYIQPRNTSRGLAAMVSASRDGALLSAILKTFGVQPIRGSTSRRGRQALLELVRWSERGYDLAITPDGPRGPRYQVQSGIISLAQVTGLPVFPISINFSRKICVKSWDRFQIPLPFAQCDLCGADPIHVPRDAGDEERAALRQTLESSMLAITSD